MTWSFPLQGHIEMSAWKQLRPHIRPDVRASEPKKTLMWEPLSLKAPPVRMETRGYLHTAEHCPPLCNLINEKHHLFYCLPIYRLLCLRDEVSLSIMHWTDSNNLKLSYATFLLHEQLSVFTPLRQVWVTLKTNDSLQHKRGIATEF